MAQNYINNDIYHPSHMLENDKFLDHIRRNVPTNKVGAAQQPTKLAAYLASESCTHMVSQILPLAGGWVTCQFVRRLQSEGGYCKSCFDWHTLACLC